VATLRWEVRGKVRADNESGFSRLMSSDFQCRIGASVKLEPGPTGLKYTTRGDLWASYDAAYHVHPQKKPPSVISVLQSPVLNLL